jgi:drug/metabolite transporter (DMT)-like permease
MKKEHLGVFYVVVSATGFAASNILVKLIHLHTDLPTVQVAIWRFIIAAPLMWLALLIKKPEGGLVPNQLWKFLILGLVFSVAGFSTVFALERLQPSLYVILIYIYPSLVVLYALLVGKPVPQRFWLGLPLTLIGLVLTSYHFGESLVVDILGLLITLVNALGMAGYLIFSEYAFARGESRQVGTTWMVTATMGVSWILVFFLGLTLPTTLAGWLLISGLGTLGTLIPLLALNNGLQLLGAARGSMLNTLQPVLAVLFSTIFLGDTLRLQQWIGGALVLLAVIVLQSSPDRQRRKESALPDE